MSTQARPTHSAPSVGMFATRGTIFHFPSHIAICDAARGRLQAIKVEAQMLAAAVQQHKQSLRVALAQESACY